MNFIETNWILLKISNMYMIPTIDWFRWLFNFFAFTAWFRLFWNKIKCYPVIYPININPLWFCICVHVVTVILQSLLNWLICVHHRFVLVLWCLTQLSQYFSYMLAVSFIAGGNRSTRGKPPTCSKWLTNFIT